MSPLAQTIGVNRIVRGKAVPNPFGDPAMAPDEEREFRKRLLERTIAALLVPVDHPTVFEMNE